MGATLRPRWLSFRCESEQSEGRQPMLAHIVAGDVRQAGVEMRLRDLRPSERPPAPGAAEVDPVDMRDLAVRAVGDVGRREQARGLALVETRQERPEPGTEGPLRKAAAHAQGLDQSRRQEIVPARLPARAVAVAAEP